MDQLPTTVTIRIAHPQDALAIAHIQIESWRTTYAGLVPDEFLASMTLNKQAQMFADALADHDRYLFVAEDHGHIVGFIAGGPTREELGDFDAELYAIYLLAEDQRRGSGRLLTSALASQLRFKGFRQMVVWVLAQNPAVGFYQRLGGTPAGQKRIEIGGSALSELAFGWTSWDQLT